VTPRRRTGAGAERTKRERRLAEVLRQIECVLDLAIDGNAEIRARLDVFGAEGDELQALLTAAAPPTNVVALHSQAVDRYLRQVEDLSAT
jgi:hypothetical protein